MLIIVLGLTVFVGLIVAVAVGLVIASFVFMKKVADISEQQTVISPLADEPWADEVDIPATYRDRLLVKHVEGPLFFGFARGFANIAASAAGGSLPVLRMDRVALMDQSGAYALQDALVDLKSSGMRILLVGLPVAPRDLLEAVHVIPDLVSTKDLFADFAELKAALPNLMVETERGRRGRCRTSLEVGPGKYLLGDDVDVAGERVLVPDSRFPDRETPGSPRLGGPAAGPAGRMRGAQPAHTAGGQHRNWLGYGDVGTRRAGAGRRPYARHRCAERRSEGPRISHIGLYDECVATGTEGDGLGGRAECPNRPPLGGGPRRAPAAVSTRPPRRTPRRTRDNRRSSHEGATGSHSNRTHRHNERRRDRGRVRSQHGTSGGNTTGVSILATELDGKRLEILHE